MADSGRHGLQQAFYLRQTGTYTIRFDPVLIDYTIFQEQHRAKSNALNISLPLQRVRLLPCDMPCFDAISAADCPLML